MKMNISEHQSKCENRNVNCQYCNQVIIYRTREVIFNYAFISLFLLFLYFFYFFISFISSFLLFLYFLYFFISFVSFFFFSN